MRRKWNIEEMNKQEYMREDINDMQEKSGTKVGPVPQFPVVIRTDRLTD